jgi:hypothetical protein
MLAHQVQHCFEPPDDNRDAQINVSWIRECALTGRNVG